MRQPIRNILKDVLIGGLTGAASGTGPVGALVGAGQAVLQDVKTSLPVKQSVNQQAETAIQAIANSDTVAAVPVVPMSKQPTAWAAGTGLIGTLIAFYGSNVIPQPILDGIDQFGTSLGLPPHILPALTIGGVFVYIWVRKKWFSHSITPAASDRAAAQGKIV